MAISFTISYTFTPGTTISSSQVNTNFSDEANVWIGLEALTKSFAALRVDATPTTSTDVAIKSYVDKLNAYRRPNLQFGSITTVAVESGLDGTSGDIPLLFPDGTLRTETSTTRTTFDITRNAVLVTSGAQSGLTGATSEATNTWYALYGCKVTDSSTLWVTVGSTVLPIRANFSTLNTAYGTNGWVYLGLIRNGDGASATGDILAFTQVGHMSLFQNVSADAGTASGRGLRLAVGTSATSLTYTYSAGTSGAVIPNNIGHAYWTGTVALGSSGVMGMSNAGGTYNYLNVSGQSTTSIFPLWAVASDGLILTGPAASNYSIRLSGYIDNVLGVGANPIL